MVAKCGKYRQISQQFEIEWLRNVEKIKDFAAVRKGMAAKSVSLLN